MSTTHTITGEKPKELRVYECTLYSRPRYGDPVPVVTDGHAWTTEKVAESAGKARYSYWRNLRDYYEEIELRDIRVRSLARKKADPMTNGWGARLETCNSIIRVIAKYGRHFLSENSDRREPVANPFIAHFKVDKMGELWFVDRYTRKPILVRHDKWPGFSDGGTLRGIVQRLAEHIKTGQAIDIGYGEDMARVRDEVAPLIAGETQLASEAK